MNKQKIAELRAGLETGFINGGYNSSLAYQPQFLSNNHKEGKKVLSSIEDELMSCDKFQISVAFITMGGITPLLQTLKELEKNGIPGEILTTNYLNFSEPKALEKLHGLSNITLKMYDVEKAAEGFHTKGYIFKKKEIYRIIIGSSNMTSAALTSNREWNTKVVSTEQGEVAKQIVEEYNELWNSRYALSFDNFYEEYKERYQIIKRQREIAKSEETPSIEKYRLKPNAMQVGFITNLRKILEKGEDRALRVPEKHMHLRLPCASWALNECCFSYTEVSLQDRQKNPTKRFLINQFLWDLSVQGTVTMTGIMFLRRYRP